MTNEIKFADTAFSPKGIPLSSDRHSNEESKKMDAFQPSDLEKELNNVAFKSQLGEFALYSFEPSDMASREELFLESLRVVVDAKEVKRVIIVPAGKEKNDGIRYESSNQ